MQPNKIKQQSSATKHTRKYEEQRRQYTQQQRRQKQQQKQKRQAEQHRDDEQDGDDQSSEYSSQDQDGVLLTNKVEEKLLTVVAKLKNKDPSMYHIDKPIFQDDDFDNQQQQEQVQEQEQQGRRVLAKNKEKNKDKGNTKNGDKLTYEKLVTKKDEKSSSQQQQQEQDKNKQQLNLDQIKQNFKNKLNKKSNANNNNENDNNTQYRNNDNDDNDDDDDMFKIKRKIQLPKKTSEQKIKQFVSNFNSKQSQNLLSDLWKNDNKLDKTDKFLRNYIVNQRWKTSKLKKQDIPVSIQDQHMIDEQDEQRSLQMDQYQQNYNFRYQEPGSDKIVQYPREIPESMRIKPETRKEKRKKLAERKKQEQEAIRKQYEEKKKEKKQQILELLNNGNKKNKKNKHEQNENQMKDQGENQAENEEEEEEDNEQQNGSQFQHDWFFCDDCAKALQQNQQYHVCYQCGQYMLCGDCYQLIIHKHPMEKAVIPVGSGPPQSQVAEKALQKLKPCKNCRKKIPHYLKHYEYTQKSSHLLSILCQKCYDESNLQIKKKFKPVEPEPQSITNYQQILQKNPQKIKQLNNQKDIEQLVDQYLKCDFEDIIGGGLKTKFKYINVKPESYGLSDQQILYGDDKQLNKYISIKKLGAYEDEILKLRNNQYNKKIKFINKSATQNKKLVNKAGGNAVRAMKKMQTRAQLLKKRRQARSSKLRIINISNQENQAKMLIKKSRLESYGLAVEGGNDNKGKDGQKKGKLGDQGKSKK